MNYSKFIDELYSLQDLKYKEFNSKICCSDNVIGVKTPELKRLAKDIARNDYLSFFDQNKHEFFEENMVHGLVIGYLKLDFNKLKDYIDSFLPFIDNWAVCDCTAANLKIFKNKKIKDLCFKEIKNYLKSDNPWINRFGYVLLLDYFIDDEYIDSILKFCNNYKDNYYIKMSIAWLVSVCYIKYKNKTLEFLRNNNLDDWTFNKAIKKIIESNRVDINDKDMLRGLKRK